MGQTEKAIERLRWMLSWATPTYITPARLRMDPRFDDLRGHPDFEALVEKVSQEATCGLAFTGES